MKNHMGMWLFLASELLIFGVLITLYQIALNQNYDIFKVASGELHFELGTINTAVLLTSSYFVALGGLTKKRFWFILAILLGAAFISIKGYEYYDLTKVGKFPLNFVDQPHQKMLFFTYYGFLTFLHLLHVFIGMVLLGLSWIWFHDPKERNLPHNAGLYWHFVDMVWVFIYPLFYLVGH